MDWSIQDVARLAGTTSRTLRHYEAVGLLTPSRTASNGYRHYDEAALRRLQRILLLREMGLGLPQIGEVLARTVSERAALAAHVEWLREEQARLARQLASVEATIRSLEKGGTIVAETMFDGFDHTVHREEVERRWGREAYAASDAWWRGLGEAGRAAWQASAENLARDWREAAERGDAPNGEAAMDLAARHVAWLRSIPGTPASAADGDVRGYVIGLGELYVADPRFAANYGGEAGAAFVRDALRAYAEAEL